MGENKNSSARKMERGGSWKIFGSFFHRVKLSWGFIILALIVSIVYYGAVSFVPGSTAALYAGDFSMAAIMGLVVNYVCTLVLSLASSVSQLFASARSVRSARNSVWKRMIGIRTDYYNENDPGKLLSAVTSDTEAAVSLLITVIISVPSMILYLLMCLAQVSMYNKKLLAVLFVLIPVYILYAFFMGRWQYRTGRRIQMRIGGLTGFLSERIRNLTLIKSFATEKKEETAGIEASEDLYKANIQYQYISGILTGFTFFTDAVATVLAVLWGCLLLQRQEIDLEAWLAFFLFVPMINTVLRQISMMWGNIKKLQGRASRLGAMMEAPQEDLREQAGKEVPQGDIVFDHVSFGYHEEKKVLSDISLTIPQGKMTAITGVSGSGKTTILKLIEQLYTPGEGRILTGGQEIDTVNLVAWREKISYVNQDATTFGGTIRECLTYGIHRQVSEEEITEAARQAGIDQYISEQPQGMETPMAIWGNAMSGGQKQRMVIARELLKNADIILLDEPTSALDAETAAGIVDTIYRQFQGKTIVTVSHELNFIARADEIVVLKQGRVVGSGSHETLMEQCPDYRELVEEQSYEEVYEA